MERIKKFMILNVKLNGFKIFNTPQSFKLGSSAYIYGGNGQGKTTIADAIAYAFCGTSFRGERSTDRLLNSKSNNMYVEVDFVDDNGVLHNLTRTRNGSVTEIIFDKQPCRQTDLTEIFADKDIFLSELNPLYFIEKIAKDGREFLQKLLPPVPHERVLAAMDPAKRAVLNNEGLADPAYYIKTRRDKLKALDSEKIYLTGQMDYAKEQRGKIDDRRTELTAEIKRYESKINPILAHQFKGIDVEDVKRRYEAAVTGTASNALLEIEKKRSEIKQRKYDSKFTPEIDKIKAELTRLLAEHNRLMALGKKTRLGVECPVCTHKLTEQEFNSFKADTMKKLSDIQAKAKALQSQLKELAELDKQAYDKFSEFVAEDLKKLDAEEKNAGTKSPEDAEKLAHILRCGNYTDVQMDSLEAAQKELTRLKAELATLGTAEDQEETIRSCETRLADIEREMSMHEQCVQAAKEYMVKRAELLLMPLKMKRAAIRLFDVVKTTGEIKDAFKFTYDGKEYTWLSTSERIKAGMEVAGLIKRLTGLVYPTFIDNAECINTEFALPGGQMIYAFARKCPLTIRNASPAVQQKEAA